jgi:D-alanyl-D-alanine carboxypeptidase
VIVTAVADGRRPLLEDCRFERISGFSMHGSPPRWMQVLFWVAVLMAGVASARANPQLLVDMTSGEVLFEEDAGLPWHPASLTKLMTAYLAFEAIETGRASLDTPVIMSAHALEAPPSKMGFPVGTAVRLEDALFLLVVKSANDVAVAVAETISGSEPAFVRDMNDKAGVLGMTATHFTNPNGLHDPEQVTTARDLALLALSIRARYPQYDTVFRTGEVEFGRLRIESYNNLLTEYPGATGMKTGYVCSSGLNIVATAEREGRSLMAVVLGASSARERGELAALLLDRGFAFTAGGATPSVLSVRNEAVPPMDMRPQLCGRQAAAYVAERNAAFPFGLKGEPSYLTSGIEPLKVRVSTIAPGAFGPRVERDLPLPRPRPGLAPVIVTQASLATPSFLEIASPVPLPRPRPAR